MKDKTSKHVFNWLIGASMVIAGIISYDTIIYSLSGLFIYSIILTVTEA